MKYTLEQLVLDKSKHICLCVFTTSNMKDFYPYLINADCDAHAP